MIKETLLVYWSSIKGVIQYVSRREVHDLTGLFRKRHSDETTRDILLMVVAIS